MIADTFTKTWLNVLRELSAAGWSVAPRGKQSVERIGSSLQFPMAYPILVAPNRELSYSFMFREAWWILSGQNRVDFLTPWAPSYMRFSDDGIRLAGAYGPKIVDQIGFVVETLGNDPYSRQAVINIWRENPRASKDIPCTLSVQFLIRYGMIHTIVSMRSSDVWLGLPYDVFTFTMLAVQVGIELNKSWGMDLALGDMYHHAGSRHYYVSNSEGIKRCLHYELANPVESGPKVDLKQICAFFPDSTSFIQLLHECSLGNLPPIETLPWLHP